MDKYEATPSEVIGFNQVQLKRAKVHLAAAQSRGDEVAVNNILRKIAVYEYTIELAKCYVQDTMYLQDRIERG